MPYDIRNDVQKVKNNIIKDYFIKYTVLCILFFKFCIDAIYQNSISGWLFLLIFLYLIYLLYRENKFFNH